MITIPDDAYRTKDDTGNSGDKDEISLTGGDTDEAACESMMMTEGGEDTAGDEGNVMSRIEQISD